MNKTAIKNFAVWARNKLIADISYRAGLIGITENGIASALPQSTGTTEFYDIGTAEPYSISGDAVRQRRRLVELIERKEQETDYKTAYKYIIEEVAYTWFNRLIAIRFMEVNDYLPSHIRVLSSESGKMEPDLVTTPFEADLDFTGEEEQLIIQLKQSNRLDGLFRILFIKQCNALNAILPELFERTQDYSELLLNVSVVDTEGVIRHLINDIPEEDFDVENGGQVEIIGWLYQYYNTEPKNEAFAKKGKVSKEEIPAMTQLFTPDWIVRYMVENSLGRLWINGHGEELLSNWKYYLSDSIQNITVEKVLENLKKEYESLKPEDIKILDPCMGSGHILVYAFDVLMQIYESVGYSQRDAAKSIIENNLYGLDIDDRAFQMAYFAVMMKARQYNRRIFTSRTRPNLYSIYESNTINKSQIQYFGSRMNNEERAEAIVQLDKLLNCLKDAKEYGSVIKVPRLNWPLLHKFADDLCEVEQLTFELIDIDKTQEQIEQIIAIGEIMANKYHVVCTNPPYMAVGNASPQLYKFINKEYPVSKLDLFAVFIEVCKDFTNALGYVAMITMHSWMFLSSYEKLRQKVLDESNIINMAHMGARGFDEIGGEIVQTVAFVLGNNAAKDYRATYARLVDGKSQSEKERMFLSQEKRYIASKELFAKIPSVPIIYWLSERIANIFTQNSLISDIADPRQGLATADNERFIRLWWEVDINNIGFDMESREKAALTEYKYFPHNKGGELRRWFGSNYYVVDWYHDGANIKADKLYKLSIGKCLESNSKPKNMQYYFRKGITWSLISTSRFGVRCFPQGMIFDVGSHCVFADDTIYNYIAAYLNSDLAEMLLNMLNPTMNFSSGVIGKLPIVINETHINEINKIVDECVYLAETDWDENEVSWNYKKAPLVSYADQSVEGQCKKYKVEYEEKEKTLEQNEIQLNCLINDSFGITKEDVFECNQKNSIIHQRSEQDDIKALISYAVGCMFGRYSVDNEGIVYAGGIWDSTKYESFIPDSDNVLPITDEEYLEDDVVTRFCTWLKVVYGADLLEQNLDYIANNLGTKGSSSREKIRNYFLTEFYKDHCSTYSVTGSGKRPIYWLFDSGKQNGFKALIYMHRYNADTIGNLRVDYLHKMQRVYESEINRMQDMIDHSTNAREVGNASKRKEKLQKQLKECREYDEKIGHLALSRIDIDLDDGVKVNYEKVQTASDGKKYQVLAKI